MSQKKRDRAVQPQSMARGDLLGGPAMERRADAPLASPRFLPALLLLFVGSPYNLTAGSDLNADGTNNDRWIDPATGKRVSLNTGRGDNTTVLDLRSTKFLALGEERKLGIFVEFFNLFNTANFGGQYSGNGRSVNFRRPTGFIPGLDYPRQVQLGARFLF